MFFSANISRLSAVMNVSPSSTAFDKLGEEQKKQVWVDTMKITLLKNPKNHQFEKI